MTEPLLAVTLVGASVVLAYGLAVIPHRARGLLRAAGPKPSSETQLIALAKAEIAATKRGDLLAAARYAEEQERAA